VSPAIPARKDYYRILAECLPKEALVVTALGNASYLWAALRDAPENFYFEDAMGLALPFALGLAVAQPERKVVVVEGDGGLMMHLGALVTVGAVAPGNLTILLIQNGVHAASGGQPVTSSDLDLAALGRCVNLKRADNVKSTEEFQAALISVLHEDGPSLLALATLPDLDVVTPPGMLDPVALKRRFMNAIGAKTYVPTMFGGGVLADR
jgi:thiamine pyrophosphate-dependent acetolactate synthase large subunit-like protein